MNQDPRNTGRAAKSDRESESDESPAVRIKINDRRRVSAEDEDVARAADADDPERTERPERIDAEESEVETLKVKLVEAETRFREAERQIQDLADRFRKAQSQLKSETDELRTRLQRSFDQKLETARGDLVAGLLETLDNLKRAVQSAESSERRQADFDSLVEGVRSTANMFESRMKSLGLSEVASTGEDFNPEVHEAVEIVGAAPEDDNRVVSELQPGYRFGDRLLRPARVRVGRTDFGRENRD